MPKKCRDVAPDRAFFFIINPHLAKMTKNGQNGSKTGFLDFLRKSLVCSLVWSRIGVKWKFLWSINILWKLCLGKNLILKLLHPKILHPHNSGFNSFFVFSFTQRKEPIGRCKNINDFSPKNIIWDKWTILSPSLDAKVVHLISLDLLKEFFKNVVQSKGGPIGRWKQY